MVVINDICLDIVYPSRVSTGTSLTEQLVLFMTKIVLFVHFSIEMHASARLQVNGPYNSDRKFSRTTNIAYIEN